MKEERPVGNWYGMPLPTSVPHYMPDRKEKDDTLLVNHKGQPILIRRPRHLGFRNPETK